MLFVEEKAMLGHCGYKSFKKTKEKNSM